VFKNVVHLRGIAPVWNCNTWFLSSYL